MKKDVRDRRRLLYALVEHAEQSGTFNPLFHRKEMMERLGLTEGQFNTVQQQLGDRYCSFLDVHGGEDRYQICVSECLALRDRIELEITQEKRHNQLVRMAILVAVLGAILGAALTAWLR